VCFSKNSRLMLLDGCGGRKCESPLSAILNKKNINWCLVGAIGSGRSHRDVTNLFVDCGFESPSLFFATGDVCNVEAEQ